MVEFRAILYILATIVGGFTFLSIFFLHMMRMVHERRESQRASRESEEKRQRMKDYLKSLSSKVDPTAKTPDADKEECSICFGYFEQTG